MKEKLQEYKNKTIQFWQGRTLGQKSVMIGAAVAVLLLLVFSSMFASNPKMVPLYSNLSLQEVGHIKAELDNRGITYELSAGGKTILVPPAQVDSLLVDLAAVGLPNSGNVDYSYFSKNASWGMTDNEFNMIQLDAMQTELANLIKSIEGIQDAKVMLNKPKDPIFIGEQTEAASASIVINTAYGFQFEESKINALYHLVSKSVPNLPTDNIVIMNQFFEYFDLKNENNYSAGNAYTYQQNIKKDIERDIQRRVQQMLSMMIGQDKVMVSVTSDIDFTQEDRIEQVVEPVNMENSVLPVSVERITETYSGNPPVGGEVGTGNEDVPNYPAANGAGNGDYEMMKESINNEFNRIRKNIVESPYTLRDLGIQVAVDRAKSQTDENGDIQYLTQQEQQTVQDGINSILSSIVLTSIAKQYVPTDPLNNISIVFQEFNGKPEFSSPNTPGIPPWMYAVGGVLLIIIIALAWMLLKNRKQEEVTEVEEYNETAEDVPNIDKEPVTESSQRRKQLERMAKDKPEDFAKLLRSWIADE